MITQCTSILQYNIEQINEFFVFILRRWRYLCRPRQYLLTILIANVWKFNVYPYHKNHIVQWEFVISVFLISIIISIGFNSTNSDNSWFFCFFQNLMSPLVFRCNDKWEHSFKFFIDKNILYCLLISSTWLGASIIIRISIQ